MAQQEQVENQPLPLTDEQRKQKEQKDYEKETKEKMAKFVVGGTDTIGNTIKRIFSKGDEFVIYDISGVSSIESMKVFIRSKKEDDIELEKRYQLIKEEFSKFKSVLYKTNADLSYKWRAANAISVALCGNKDVDVAKRLLETITKEALDEYKEIQCGRLWYLCGALIFTLITTLVALGLYLLRTSDFVSNNQGLTLFVYASAFSAFGGLLSISIKLKEILIEKELDNIKYALYGAQRLLFSILAGFAVVILIKSGIVFANLMAGNNHLYALMTMCYLAGFSETLIPNALKNLEEKSEKKP
ncbi:MAG: hypothetical protein ACXWFG_06225 [Methylobacter sp.]